MGANAESDALHVQVKTTATSTSVKHRNFLSEPIGDKDVKSVAGVGDVYGRKLAEAGYDKAYVLLGQFLVLKKDATNFKAFLKDEFSVADRYAEQVFQCLN